MQRLAEEKGAPLDDAEQDIALERVRAARLWLEDLAPAQAKLEVHYASLPPSAGELSDAQEAYLGALADAAEAGAPVGGEAWQALIFETARSMNLKPGDAFGAIYRVFLDRPNGPRAGWLLASLASPFVIGRLREAVGPGRSAMSVGLQRLREDADAIRRGAHAKREDPALIDQALALDGERRSLLSEIDTLRAERKNVSAQVGAAMKAGGAGADELKAHSVELGTRDRCR